ncbi:unnamed protein product [Allacma fusca]|uniref:Transposase n=1 Tax=Allacma fusca TaxID=39272 RepID=A0A8J2NVT1_9HEXA|nr:unnamed protein product [Allacma fusca]
MPIGHSPTKHQSGLRGREMEHGNGKELTGKRKQQGEEEDTNKKARTMSENSEENVLEDAMDRLLEKLSKKMDSMETRVTKRLDEVEERIAGRIEILEARVDELEAENCQLKGAIEEMREENAEIREKYGKMVNQQDRINRRNNLIFMGVEEKSGETPGQLRENIQKLINVELEIDDVFIDAAYRVGRGKTRPVKVRVIRMSEKDAILKNKRKLKSKNIPIFIIPDLTPEDAAKSKQVREERRKQRDPRYNQDIQMK